MKAWLSNETLGHDDEISLSERQSTTVTCTSDAGFGLKDFCTDGPEFLRFVTTCDQCLRRVYSLCISFVGGYMCVVHPIHLPAMALARAGRSTPGSALKTSTANRLLI